jgi:hypothetical protein
MKRLTILFITLCIAIFVWVGLSGINFIQVSSVEEEPFATGTSPITRASDCNCLPGYIPSSQTNGYNGKIFLTIERNENYYLFNPDGTKDVYWISTGETCGIPNINLPSKPNSGNYTYLASDDIFGAGRKYSYKGQLRCNMVKKIDVSGIFFCQNLGNPEKRRNCY